MKMVSKAFAAGGTLLLAASAAFYPVLSVQADPPTCSADLLTLQDELGDVETDFGSTDSVIATWDDVYDTQDDLASDLSTSMANLLSTDFDAPGWETYASEVDAELSDLDTNADDDIDASADDFDTVNSSLSTDVDTAVDATDTANTSC